MTPVRLNVVAYFSRHLEGKKQAPRNNKRVKPRFYGEALTKDEVFVRIEETERAKEKEAEEKRERQKRKREKAEEKREQQKRKKEKAQQKKPERKRGSDDAAHDNEDDSDNEEDEENREDPDEHTDDGGKSIDCVVGDDNDYNLIISDEEDSEEDECQVCGGCYSTDTEDKKKGWIGCDGPGCHRWFHFWCAGYKRKPSTRAKFLCYACKPSKA